MAKRLVTTKLAETVTIVAAKVAVTAIGLSVTVADIQEIRLFLYCTKKVSTEVPPDPSETTGFAPYTEHEDVDTITLTYAPLILSNSQEVTCVMCRYDLMTFEKIYVFVFF